MGATTLSIPKAWSLPLVVLLAMASTSIPAAADGPISTDIPIGELNVTDGVPGVERHLMTVEIWDVDTPRVLDLNMAWSIDDQQYASSTKEAEFEITAFAVQPGENVLERGLLAETSHNIAYTVPTGNNFEDSGVLHLQIPVLENQAISVVQTARFWDGSTLTPEGEEAWDADSAGLEIKVPTDNHLELGIAEATSGVMGMATECVPGLGVGSGWDLDAFGPRSYTTNSAEGHAIQIGTAPGELCECPVTGTMAKNFAASSSPTSGTADAKIEGIIHPGCRFEVPLPSVFTGRTTGQLGDPLVMTVDGDCDQKNELDWDATVTYNLEFSDVSYTGRSIGLPTLMGLEIDMELAQLGNYGGVKGASAASPEGCEALRIALEGEARAEMVAYANGVLQDLPVPVHGFVGYIEMAGGGWLFALEGDGVAKIHYSATFLKDLMQIGTTSWTFDAAWAAVDANAAIGSVESHGESTVFDVPLI